MSRVCLSRKRGESILIGDDVLVTITKVKTGPNGGHTIYLAIDAPKEKKIYRLSYKDGLLTLNGRACDLIDPPAQGLGSTPREAVILKGE